MRFNFASGLGIFIGLTLLSSAGCATSHRDRSLQGVAKEWSKTIRASQVVPVYPLTQDIQVGDVYIVDYPLEDEQLLWERDGYLPLPQHLVRLSLTSGQFEGMYPSGAHGVGPTTAASPPYVFEWVAPATRPAATPVASESASSPATTVPPATRPLEIRRDLQRWRELAPQSNFPPYSVQVSVDSGLDVGLPIQGIPVAVGLLGSQTASASVTLTEAYTYGVDNYTILRAIRERTKQDSGLTDVLARYAPYTVRNASGYYQTRYRFIRVITRVYLVGGATVTVTDNTRAGANVKVGLLSNIGALLGTNSNASGIGYQKLIDTLNGRVAEAASSESDDIKSAPPATAPSEETGAASTTAPAVASKPPSTQPDNGLSFKFAAVSDRSITLNQSFETPLVIGYIAVDLPIGAGGTLGSRPIDTFRRLEKQDVKHSGAIRDWLLHDPTASKLLLAWGTAEDNKQWLNDVGFSAFAINPTAMKTYFLSGVWDRFAFRVKQGNSLPWKALTDRIAQDCIGLPQGLERVGSEQAAAGATGSATKSTTRYAPQLENLIQQMAR